MTFKSTIGLRYRLLAIIALVPSLAICQDSALATPPAVNADYDGDGVVGQGDLVKWSEGFGCGAPNSDGGGFLEWQRQLGQRSMPVVLVPEPATLVVWSLLGFAAAGTCILRKKRAA